MTTRQQEESIAPLHTVLLTTVVMLAFAANSIICREVLKSAALDAASFTTIRILSGALILWPIATLSNAERKATGAKSRRQAFMLFAYAAAFSFAYLDLSVATGALILFGAVQVTMMLSGFLAGERLNFLEWIGFMVAVAGFVVLVYPGLTAPSPKGAVLMFIAGMAWGFYSLLGKGSENPVHDSAINFRLAAPICLAVSIIMVGRMHLTTRGLLLAVLSGAVTTGCAYVIWYKALRGLTVIRASIVQLSVPVIAAFAGVLLLAEAISARLLMAGALILGGVAVGLGGLSRRREV